MTWFFDDDEDEKKKKRQNIEIASVQDAWQPSDEMGGNTNTSSVGDSYLFSKEKQEGDANFEKQLAEEAEAKRQAQIRAEQMRQQAIAYANAMEAQKQQAIANEQENQQDKQDISKDDGWKKYYDTEFKNAENKANFWQKIFDHGSIGRQAEERARQRYNSELLDKAYDDQGNIKDLDTAKRSFDLSNYNMALANRNHQIEQAFSNKIGASKEGAKRNPILNTVNAIGDMQLYNAVGGVDNPQNFGADDILRGATNMVQGVFTAPITAPKKIGEALTKYGLDENTGLDKELTGLERGGRALSGMLDIAGMFSGGASSTAGRLASKIVGNTASKAETSLFKTILKEAGDQGLLGATGAGAEYLSRGKDITDENGDFNDEAVKDFATEIATGGAIGAGLGGLLSGVAHVRGKDLERGMEFVGDKVDEGIGKAINKGIEARDNAKQWLQENTDNAKQRLQEGVDNTKQTLQEGVDNTKQRLQENYDNLRNRIDNNLERGVVLGELPEPTNARRMGDDFYLGENIRPTRERVTRLDELNTEPQPRTKNSKEINTAEYLQGDTPNAKTFDKSISPTQEVGDGKYLKNAISTLGEGDEGLNMLKRTFGSLEDNVDDVLADLKGSDKIKAELKSNIAKLNENKIKYNEIQKKLQDNFRVRKFNKTRNFGDSFNTPIGEDLFKRRNAITAENGILMEKINRDTRALAGDNIKGAKLANYINSLVGYKNTNTLLSANAIQKNWMQDATGSLKDFLNNPVAFTRSLNPKSYGFMPANTVKRELKKWTVTPRTASDVAPYLFGNIYRTLMIPTAIFADARKGFYREALAERTLRQAGAKNITHQDIVKFSKMAGNNQEVLANMLTGINNGTSNELNVKRALKAYQDMLANPKSVEMKREFINKVEATSNLADRLIKATSGSNDFDPKTQFKSVLVRLFLPFYSIPENMLKNAVTQGLNPVALHMRDEVLRDVRSKPQNAVNILKNCLMKYGFLAGAGYLWSTGTVGYNDGNDVDKPRGFWLDRGDNRYMPIRSISEETLLSTVLTTVAMAEDVAKGEKISLKKYVDMISGSLPYIDQATNLANIGNEIKETDTDNMYNLKQYGVNTVKSLVPFSNNQILPVATNIGGHSLDAKSTYDKDFGTWLGNSLKKAYATREVYDKMPTSRDMAGRARTSDSGGIFVNKTINDPNTQTYNYDVKNMLGISKALGQSSDVKDAFNTYGNNNFRTTQGAINNVDGKGYDKDSLLENNQELGKLAKQIKAGWDGDGVALLTLNGNNLMSDASAPNSKGSKNTSKPLNMQTIKNAIAQSDLSAEDNAQLREITNAKTEAYQALRDKRIDYKTYQGAMTNLLSGERNILMNSAKYQALDKAMNSLNDLGFFGDGGMGSTKAGQNYLWNLFDNLLGEKGKTPFAEYPKESSNGNGYGRGYRRGYGGGYHRGGGYGSTNISNNGASGYKNDDVRREAMANVNLIDVTPFAPRVHLDNAIQKNKVRQYKGISF